MQRRQRNVLSMTHRVHQQVRCQQRHPWHPGLSRVVHQYLLHHRQFLCPALERLWSRSTNPQPYHWHDLLDLAQPVWVKLQWWRHFLCLWAEWKPHVICKTKFQARSSRHRRRQGTVRRQAQPPLLLWATSGLPRRASFDEFTLSERQDILEAISFFWLHPWRKRGYTKGHWMSVRFLFGRIADCGRLEVHPPSLKDCIVPETLLSLKGGCCVQFAWGSFYFCLSMTMARATFLKSFRTWSCCYIWGRHYESCFLCCGWTGCCWTWFELACTCLEFCFLEKHGTWCCEWFCIRSMVVWVVMACDENLWRNSEGIWVSENFQEGWCHWHSNMLLSWHNRELTHEVLRFRDHQNGSDVKRGIDSDFAMMKWWELFYKNVFHRFLIPCRS